MAASVSTVTATEVFVADNYCNWEPDNHHKIVHEYACTSKNSKAPAVDEIKFKFSLIAQKPHYCNSLL